MKKVNCEVCSDEINEPDKFIECERCSNYAHLECSKVNIGLRLCADCDERKLTGA